MITNNSSEVKNHWNKIGDNYQNFWHSPAQKIMSQDETGFIKCHILNRFTDILDLGCGNGRILEALIQKSRNDSNIYGLDISSKMIEYCKEKFQKEKKIKELQVLDDNRNLDVYKKKFDLITSIRVMKYNKNRE